MAPPTMTTEAPASIAWCAFSEWMPPATQIGTSDRRGDRAQQGERIRALHLLVDGGVDVDHVHAQRGHLLRPRHGVARAQQVGDDLGAVLPARLHAFRDGGSRSAAASTCTVPAPAFAAASTSDPARVHHLHVGRDDQVGEARPQTAHRVQAHALDQRGAGLQDIRAPRRRLLRHLERAIQFQEIERDLQPRPGLLSCHISLSREEPRSPA